MIRFLLLFLSCLFLGFKAAQTPTSPLGTIFAILFLISIFFTCFIPLMRTFGKRRASLLCLALALYALVFETMALKTGIPYGVFQYTGLIGTTLPGGASWTIPLGWIPLILSAAQLSQRFSSSLSRLLMGMGLACVFDLCIDPVATAMGYWHWHDSSYSYYGVPLQNFFGWLISGALGLILIQVFFSKEKSNVFPSEIHRGALLLLAFHVGATIAFEQWIATFFGLVGSALLIKGLHQRPELETAPSP